MFSRRCTCFIRRRVWLGWHKMTLAVLPLSILPDAQMIRLFPGIDETQPFFDKRHLSGEEVPQEESWQWADSDMLILARKNGLVPAAVKEVKTDDVAIATGDKTEGAAAAPGALAPLKFDINGRVLDKDGVALSDWKSKVAQIKHAFADKSTPLLFKVYLAVKFVFFAGVDRDIADYKSDDKEVQDLHSEANAEHYYGKTEQVFRFLQVLTSSVAAFAHGANDVALSVGPIATMYFIWQKGSGRGSVPSSSVVLDWQLAVGALSLCAGLWFYGERCV